MVPTVQTLGGVAAVFTMLAGPALLVAQPTVQIDSVPACVADASLEVTGQVFGPEAIQTVTGSVTADGAVNGFGLCSNCGFDPSYTFDATLSRCSNLVSIHAVDTLGRMSTESVVVRFDDTAPALDCPADVYLNADVFVNGAFRWAEYAWSDPAAGDSCDGSLVPSCNRDDEFFIGPGEENRYYRGTTRWRCSVRDQCLNRGSCQTNIVVLPAGRALPAAGCEFYEFRDLLLLDAPIQGVRSRLIGTVFEAWDTATSSGGEIVTFGGSLEPTRDNVAFFYQEPTGDFRVETPKPGGSGIDGSAAGLMVRWGLGPEDPRVAVALRPNGPAADTLEFLVRDAIGATDQVVATLSPAGVTDLAIQVDDGRVTLQLSSDGGQSWSTPEGTSVDLAPPGDPQAGIFTAANEDFFGNLFIFPYLEICPVLDLDPPPPGSCSVEDDFEDGVLDAGWTLTGLGNANQLSVDETGGVLELSADGATAFAGADNAGYVYRSVAGDFRAEVTVDGSTMTDGGAFRKAGLNVRADLDPWSPRVQATLVPFWNDSLSESHLQFIARLERDRLGNPAVARDVVNVPQQVRLAIERAGDVFSVEYSLDDGATWIRPTTGLGGSATVAMPASVLVGMAVISNDIIVPSMARFDDMAICALP